MTFFVSPNFQPGELLKQFQDITGADAETSRFYLEAAGWQLNAATSTFFESGGAAATPAQRGAPTPQPTSQPRPSATAKSQPRSGRVAGFSDLSSTNAEGQDYFTGGKSSGMVVRDPQKEQGPDIVRNLMENARNALGAVPKDQMPAPQQPSFSGSGYRLGNTAATAGQRVAAEGGGREQGEVTRTLVFYKEGFTVDDGPLRTYDDPANGPFLQDINRGVAPAELEAGAGGRPVQVNLVDKKHENYKPPPKVLTPFAGAGQRLGSTTGSATPSRTTSTKPRAGGPGVVVNEAEPVTTLQIRLHDGSRMVAKFNHSHTIGHIRQHIDAHTGGGRYVLQTTIPVRILGDDSQTIKDAGLINAVIVQKLV
jgi:UBX domain-containing protein 1